MKQKYTPGLAGVLVVAALALASCGGEGAGSPSADGGPHGHEQHGAQNGDHGSMAHGERAGHSPGHGTTRSDMEGTDHSNMADMDNGSVGGQEMARRMLENEDGDYSDRLFIDMMVPHHEGAVEMARVALKKSEREQILDLSRDIVRTQEAEVEELKDVKRAEFGTSDIPTGMNEGDMEAMGMMDADELAEQWPFDKAFIDAMIPHHRSAIDMANVVLEESNNPRLRELATDIAEAQEREISRMKSWREGWYPEG